jgi:DNA-binding transcriptional regulator YhcF (GntR family)
MEIDSSSDRPVYKQLADMVRTQIENGEFAPGQRLPAQKDYMQEHYLSRMTVDRAMHVLRAEGLIVTERSGSRVQPLKTRETLHLDHGKISARIPTELERHEYRINEGIPLLVVQFDGHNDRVLPADRFDIQVGVGQSAESPFVDPRLRSPMSNSELFQTAQKMTDLITLIQQHPAEARRIIAAVDDGLTLGPAQVMPSEMDCQLVDQTDAGEIPTHLPELIGALEGSADLGLNHDKYLSSHGGEE